MSVVPLHTPRWEPDENLVEAAIAGRVHHSHLTPHDRAWLVAHLTHRGVTTDTIAAWLGCSRRTVQMVRAEPVAVLTTRLLATEADAARASSRARIGHITAHEHARLLAEIERLKESRGALIEQLAAARRVECPPTVIVMHPTGRTRRARPTDSTLPLFPLEDSE
ncbi:hypothetical protein [Nocardia farcinica]|uniref:hypothetical protein n=1 Tax=Nocardia farcinica TaxID=37329 RepID=UPI0018936F9A|nr:hypothetical protein [Nocardia farcinica]MBF6410930.1 hypothetical protein [Nocardia farcinica]